MDDKSFIENSEQWPRWPLCPVKNHLQKQPDGWPRMGVILDDGTKNRTVWLDANPFDFHINPSDESTRRVYTSTDELLADGWVVD